MKKTIKDFKLDNKRVLIRVDFNVPIEDGKIVDDTRIKEALPTIRYAIENNSKVILISHLGRVKTIEDKKDNSLKIVSLRLSELLGKNVIFIESLEYGDIKNTIENMNYGDVCLLENSRFYDIDGDLESGNSIKLSEMYASFGDIYINDAFGTIHRKHASTFGVASILPNGIGFLVEKELEKLEYLNNPDRKYAVIIGGSKVSDKIGVIEKLVEKCDYLIIGGKMAFTFLKARGYDVGKNSIESEYLDFCNKILYNYTDKIILPVDFLCSKEMSEEKFENKKIIDIESDDYGLDLGDETISNIISVLEKCKTVFWNGPLGYYQLNSYIKSTKEILTYLTNNTNIKTILGGGDIVACSTKLNLKDKVYHASTGGGATLEYLEGKLLPGLVAIKDKE